MKRANSKLLIVFAMFFLFQSIGQSSIPTPEALFRNSSNKRIDGDFIVLNLSIEEIENHVFMKKTKTSQISDEEEKLSLENSEKEKNKRKLHVQLLFELSEEDKKENDSQKLELLQVEFSKKGFKKSDAIRSVYFPSFNNRVLNDSNLARGLFYSVLTILAANQEDLIVKKIKELVPQFKTNKELLNKEKMEILEKYKEYLKEARKKKEEIEEAEEVQDRMSEKALLEKDKEKYKSPLKAEDEEEQKKINELLDSRMYNIDKHVNLEKDGREFYWTLKYDEMKAVFSNRDQKFKSLMLKTESHPVEFKLRYYILFDGVHELPKTIYFKTGNQQLFEIKVLGFKDFKNDGPSLSERASEYRQNLRKKKPSRDKEGKELPLLKPDFLY